MIISYENRYIFIAVPKTGTTSIQKLLLENDLTARNYGIKINGKCYNFGEPDTVLQIKSELGELYSEFRTLVLFVIHIRGSYLATFSISRVENT